MFLGTSNKVYIVDKTERNPVNVTSKYGTHPAVSLRPGLASARARAYAVLRDLRSSPRLPQSSADPGQ